MWTIIKIDKNKFEFFKSELKKKFSTNTQIYFPKALIQKFNKNKLIKKEINLLGDYIFCFNSEFSKTIILNHIKNTRGVKCLLEGFLRSQKEIENFIKKCKDVEDKEGYITHSSLDAKINNYYKFSSGPFTQQIFKIINMQKNKLNILMGNYKTIIDKRDYILSSL